MTPTCVKEFKEAEMTWIGAKEDMTKIALKEHIALDMNKQNYVDHI